jgi:hypothetical protein
MRWRGPGTVRHGQPIDQGEPLSSRSRNPVCSVVAGEQTEAGVSGQVLVTMRRRCAEGSKKQATGASTGDSFGPR